LRQNKLFALVMLFVIAGFALTGFKHKHDPVVGEVLKVEQYTSVPGFSKTLTYEENIRSFYEFLRPIIKSENSVILCDRNRLKQLRFKLEKNAISTEEVNWLKSKAEYYKLKKFSPYNKEDISFLLTRMDIIPETMVMSQAAIESAFGTSGFARKANNLFGMRTLSPTNGIVPKNRAKGMKFYVAKYETINKSIQCYMRNLNTHNAYFNMRKQRRQFRNSNKPLDAYKLAEGLTRYSTEGQVYVQKIRNTMKKHEKLMVGNSFKRI